LIAPDGRTAYVAVSGDDRIAAVDLTSSTVTRQFEPGRSPHGMAFLSGR
jgi:YVTN family beta-propeller protein